MKHTLTIKRLSLDALRSLEERRRPVNSQASRLKDLATLFFEHFKKQGVSLMLHQADWKFQESYNARVGEYGIKLTVLSYNENDSVPSVVRSGETVQQINKLRSSLACFSPTATFPQHEIVYAFPMKAFVTCGDRAAFQTDCDEGIWTVWFCDRKNRVSACIEITHFSLLEDAQPAKRSA